jgi:hypothetical protein
MTQTGKDRHRYHRPRQTQIGRCREGGLAEKICRKERAQYLTFEERERVEYKERGRMREDISEEI